jgi:Uma2 family endonuclease
MSVAAKPVTADELDQFPDDGKRREIIGGELYVTPAPTPTHQEISSHLQFCLYQEIVLTGAGKVYAAPLDVRFSNLDQVQPDLLAIRQDRLNIARGKFVQGSPDIVVEILSPSNPHYDVVEKKRLYEHYGVPEYWIVDPKLRKLTVYQLTAGSYVEIEPINGMLQSTAVTEFTIDPAVLFAKFESA